MKSMETDKSPGNDGLTKEFYKNFWDDIKATFTSSTKQAKERKEYINCDAQNRNISKNGGLTSDITEITNIPQMEGFLVMMDL